ncbi:uncharacterized protein LOC126973342 isoform X2 [Leptidea sinapis]|uniref:uncharacterized protein LOC126973342 isoform X2 n=1 Tax=Leptidea sinapis TaxID=189913 RepID=UPI00212711BB|nr:uncharacterized protein LOC126973342 isoform X2 [Leptidea sinapis]
MDDTQTNRASDAAATRKRRSSILKNQRPPRTPFSELEFNVATPTDTTKNRRVSFSRKTGVAEFVCNNEGTTTWKNFYEEHNNSLQTSGNAAATNSQRQVAHLGRRIFEDQFEDLEAEDCGEELIPTYLKQIHNCTNNGNFTQQFAALDSMDDNEKLTAPVQNFEHSALTETHQKLFKDDITVPTVGPGCSSHLNVDFSIMQTLGKCDDLDMIQQDLKNTLNVVGPAFDRQDPSEYIEIDLNMTHIAPRNEQSDMSITDTVHGPVQEVSKSKPVRPNSLLPKKSLNIDNPEDKENIAVNPYITPCEADNFAVNEASDKVLVFDGKRLTLQSDKNTFEPQQISVTTEKVRRKAIVLNIDDDLPNFIPAKRSVANVVNDGDIISQRLSSTTESQKRKTIVFEDSSCNISITQAIPAQVITDNVKHETICESNDISMTKPVPANIYENNKKHAAHSTTIYDANDISLTQALSAKVMPNQNQTIHFKNNISNISMTQALPECIILENRRKTISDEIDISMTQAVPTNILLNENDMGKTVFFEGDMDISVTQAITHNLLMQKTNDNLSMTQAVPTNILLNENDTAKTVYFEGDVDISITQPITHNLLMQKSTTVSQNTSTFVKTEEYGPVADELSNPTSQGTTNIPEQHTINIVSLKKDLTLDRTQFKEDMSISQISDEETTAESDNKLSAITKNEFNFNNKKSSESTNNLLLSSSSNDLMNLENMNNGNQKENCIKLIVKDEEMIAETYSKQNTITGNDIALKKNNYSEITKNLLPSSSSSFGLTNLNNLDSGKPNEKSDLVVEQQGVLVFQVTGLVSSKTKTISNDDISTMESITKDEKDDGKSEVDVCLNKSKSGNLVEERIFDKNPAEETHSSKPPSSQYSEAKKSMLHELLDMSSIADNNINNKSLTIVKYTAESMDTSTPGCSTSSDDKINHLPEIAGLEPFKDRMDTSSSDIVTAPENIINEQLNDVKSISDNSTASSPNLSVVSPSSNEHIQSKIIDGNIKDPLKCVETESHSQESLFVITQDSNDDFNEKKHVQLRESVKIENLSQIEDKIPAITYEESNIVEDLQNKIDLLKTAAKEGKLSSNRHFEKVSSPIINKNDSNIEGDKMNTSSISEKKKPFKNANDTAELLSMLSQLTDTSQNKICDKLNKTESKEMLNKSKQGVTLNLTRRRSIAISREDMLHSISMAQALLHKSQFELDESDADIDNTSYNPDDTLAIAYHGRKSIRISSDVVKTLHFNDSYTDNKDAACDINTPLIKSVIGETSNTEKCVKDKGKVIPTYDFRDGVKELMDDLVKPMADVLPFERHIDKSPKQSQSRTSAQIQANLIASSQIDLDVDLHSQSVSESGFTKTESLVNEISELGNKSVSSALKKPVSPVSLNTSMGDGFYEQKRVHYEDTDLDMKCSHIPENKNISQRKYSTGDDVLVFDHNNPLNNVLLAPVDYENVHRYNPVKSTETIKSECDNSVQCTPKPSVVEQNIEFAHFKVEIEQKPKQVQEVNATKILSVDCSTVAMAVDINDKKVNTVIAMKKDYELLDAHSSLTLVDDEKPKCAITDDMSFESTANNTSKTSVEVMDTDNKTDEVSELSSDVDSKVTLTDEDIVIISTRKRSFSPDSEKKHKTRNSIKELLKVSSSPINKKQKTVENRKSPSKLKNINENDCMIVQQLLTEYNIKDVDAQSLTEEVGIALKESSMSIESENIAKTVSSLMSVELPRNLTVVSEIKSMDVVWSSDSASEKSLKNPVTDTESNFNVVAKIDTLTFMGSRDCEWESSANDVWSFLLLRSHVRLSVRLMHSVHNSSRSKVRADTPLLSVQIDPVRSSESQPLVQLCVRFAAEAMRRASARDECRVARDVPALLRRCVLLARLAQQWARAMQDARVHLAYDITSDGYLTLKVANIPLRSVWEVTMQIDLAEEETSGMWYPRVSSVDITTIVADMNVPSELLRRLVAFLPNDWSHAPRSIWKVFKYLKNKTRGDDLSSLYTLDAAK